MVDWLIILITAAVFVGVILLGVFAWTHRAGRLARGISGAGDRYNRFVGMGGPTEIPPPDRSNP